MLINKQYKILLFIIAVITIPSLVISSFKDTLEVVAHLKVGDVTIIHTKPKPESLYFCRDWPPKPEKEMNEKEIAIYILEGYAAWKSCNEALEIINPSGPK